MSYYFMSPHYRVLQCPTKPEALGTVEAQIGPDVPWRQENAQKAIVPATRTCSPVGHKKFNSFSTAEPPRDVAVRADIDASSCFFTGEIKEAKKPGWGRTATWCCKTRAVPSRRVISEVEARQYMDQCHDITWQPTGEIFPTYPQWMGKNDYVSGSCHETEVIDGDYKLVCCRVPPKASELTVDWSNVIVAAEATPEQRAEQLAQREQRVAETEAMLTAAAEPEYNVFQRYGVFMLMGLGAVGVAVTAGLIKRKKKQEREG